MPTVPSDPAPQGPPVAAKAKLNRRNGMVAAICGLSFLGMVGAAYAAVPLYKAFCQITGFDGTVSKADVAPTKVLDRKLAIRFDANVRDLPWDFKPEQVSQDVKIGATGLAFFKVTNHGKTPMTGRASYNVLPEQAGPYFRKLQCFCFDDQTIQPGQTVEFPVVYFVDPEFATDFETRGKSEVTLSYTFFPVESAQASASPKPSPLGGAVKAGL